MTDGISPASAFSLQPPLIVIFGPTASGKTALADALFSSEAVFPRFKGQGEIVSADSMQVYRNQNIGTAKPEATLLQRLPHHCIDVCDQSYQFCAGDFVRVAEECCSAITSSGKIPVVMGGTAFYIRNFLYGLPVTPESNAETRQRLKARMQIEGAQQLWNELHDADPISADRIHIHDEYRIVRALEVLYACGRPLSSYAVTEQMRTDYHCVVIGLERPRDELYRRINARVDEMFDQGLASEVTSLIATGCTSQDPGMQAIGYREFFANGVPIKPDGYGAVAELIKKDTRKYAKRQLTFFKSLPNVQWFNADDRDGVYRYLSSVLSDNFGNVKK